MIKNNLLTTIISIALICITILTLPTLSFITAYVNPEALKWFHFSFLIIILLAYVFILLFRSKRFYLPMISFIGVSIIWFIYYTVSQGNTYIIPSFSLVATISVINIGLCIPYIVTLIKDLN